MSKKAKIIKDTIISDKMNDDALRAYSKKRLMAAANSNAAEHDYIPAEENKIVLSLGDLLQDAYQVGTASNMDENIKISLFGQKVAAIRGYYNNTVKRNPYLVDAADNDIKTFIENIQTLPDGNTLMRIINKVGEDVANSVRENSARLALPTLQQKQQSDLNNKLIENNNYNTETLEKQLLRNNRNILNLQNTYNNDEGDEYEDNDIIYTPQRGRTNRTLDFTPSAGDTSSGFNSAQSAQYTPAREDEDDNEPTISDENTTQLMDMLTTEIDNVDTYDETELKRARDKTEELIQNLSNNPSGDKNAAKLISIGKIFIKLIDGKTLTRVERDRLANEKKDNERFIGFKKGQISQGRVKALDEIDTEEAVLDQKLGIQKDPSEVFGTDNDKAIANKIYRLADELEKEPASPEKVENINVMIKYLTPGIASTARTRNKKVKEFLDYNHPNTQIQGTLKTGATEYYKQLLKTTEETIRGTFTGKRAAVKDEFDGYEKDAETEEEVLNKKLGIKEEELNKEDDVKNTPYKKSLMQDVELTKAEIKSVKEANKKHIEAEKGKTVRDLLREFNLKDNDAQRDLLDNKPAFIETKELLGRMGDSNYKKKSTAKSVTLADVDAAIKKNGNNVKNTRERVMKLATDVSDESLSDRDRMAARHELLKDHNIHVITKGAGLGSLKQKKLRGGTDEIINNDHDFDHQNRQRYLDTSITNMLNTQKVLREQINDSGTSNNTRQQHMELYDALTAAINNAKHNRTNNPANDRTVITDAIAIGANRVARSKYNDYIDLLAQITATPYVLTMKAIAYALAQTTDTFRNATETATAIGDTVRATRRTVEDTASAIGDSARATGRTVERVASRIRTSSGEAFNRVRGMIRQRETTPEQRPENREPETNPAQRQLFGTPPTYQEMVRLYREAGNGGRQPTLKKVKDWYDQNHRLRGGNVDIPHKHKVKIYKYYNGGKSASKNKVEKWFNENHDAVKGGGVFSDILGKIGSVASGIKQGVNDTLAQGLFNFALKPFTGSYDIKGERNKYNTKVNADEARKKAAYELAVKRSGRTHDLWGNPYNVQGGNYTEHSIGNAAIKHIIKPIFIKGKFKMAHSDKKQIFRHFNGSPPYGGVSGAPGHNKIGKEEVDEWFNESMEHLRGSGIFDAIKTTFSPSNNKYYKNTQAMLNKYGNDKINSISISRTNIPKAINMIYSKILPYDQLYHLALIVNVTDNNGNNKNIIVEKNSYIFVSNDYHVDDSTQTMQITGQLPNTINEMLDLTRDKVGNNTFYLYDPLGNNCQNFLINILNANHINNPNLQKFILQDQIAKTPQKFTGKVLGKLGRFVTDSHSFVKGKILGGDAQLGSDPSTYSPFPMDTPAVPIGSSPSSRTPAYLRNVKGGGTFGDIMKVAASAAATALGTETGKEQLSKLKEGALTGLTKLILA